MPAKNLAPESPQTYPSYRRACYALFVLWLAYILSFIDRNIMAVMVDPIRAAFGLSDVEFSLLHGTAFTVFYIFLGLPIGSLADRMSRRTIIFIGVLFWSVMTFLCGLANSFLMLFLIRIGVGVGEAALSPAAYSLLGDYFSPRKLRWATAFFSTGITLGTGLSYHLGGWVYTIMDQYLAADVNWAPWQATFMLVGLPGLIVVALVFFMVEPPRQNTGVNAIQDSENKPLPFRHVVAQWQSQWQAYGALFIAVSLFAIIGYGSMAWSPAWLMRHYGIERVAAGSSLGSIYLFAGTAGSLAGAALAGYLHRAGFEDANARWVMLVAALVTLPASFAPTMADERWALGLMTLVIFLHYSHFGVAMAALQLITPNRMHGLTSALMLFVTNFFGLALGGTLIAWVTEFGFGSEQGLADALSLVAAVVYPLAFLALWFGLPYYRKALLIQTSNVESQAQLA